ncbi:L,D-transpeptidase [Pseudanabaena sp. FACHB-2040]|uniref:L,D-transpeptidase n=1 Tax=Pseudanabaena sp. FACHB-2040 TaxID=2692859 RepID=UPI0018EFB98D|nr:L,D-transpeptidase [Pseudanabaena sp. FACHB-2040]
MAYQILKLLPFATLAWSLWLYLTPRTPVASQPVTPPQMAAAKAASSNAAVDPTLESNRLEIELSRRTVTLYRNNAKVRSYPIGVGRQGWETPEGQFRVMQMRRNPVWIHPFTNESFPPGHPENPLGSYWIGFWRNGEDWIGFHGTPPSDRQTVGQAISHGCIRMYDEDIAELYNEVNLGRQVIVKP